MKRYYLMFGIVYMMVLPAQAESQKDYGEIIKTKPEYKEVTEDEPDRSCTRKSCDESSPITDFLVEDLLMPMAESIITSTLEASYSYDDGVETGWPFYVGLNVGETQFEYSGIESGGSVIFYLGYEGFESDWRYELSYLDAGEADIDEVDSVSLSVSGLNFSVDYSLLKAQDDGLGLYFGAGAHFLNSRLIGPASTVTEKSRGLTLASGLEYQLTKSFRLRGDLKLLYQVNDFADNESITLLTVGGLFDW